MMRTKMAPKISVIFMIEVADKPKSFNKIYARIHGVYAYDLSLPHL
jgi:hypothetical protein